jgi:hypothetical protein
MRKIYAYKPGLVLVVLLLVLAALSACGLARNALIGRWGDAQGSIDIEFTDAGKMILHNQGAFIEVDYQFVNDNTLSLPNGEAINIPTGTIITYAVKGDAMTLTFGDSPIELIRKR